MPIGRTYSRKSVIQGVLSMCLVAVIMTLQFLFVRFAVEQVSSTIVLLFQGGIAVLICGTLLLLRGIKAFKTDHPILHLIRDISGLIANFLYYLAIRRLALAEAVLLWTTFPLWVPILSRLTIKDHISFLTWVGVIVGFIGVAFLLHPARESVDILGIALGIGAGLFSAISLVAKKFLSHRDSALLMLFYLSLVTMVGIAPFTYFSWKSFGWAAFGFVVIASLFYIAYQWLRTYALKKAAVVILSPIIYLTIIFSGLLDWLIWDQTPDWMWWIGASLIVIGGIEVIIFHHKKNSTLTSKDSRDKWD